MAHYCPRCLRANYSGGASPYGSNRPTRCRNKHCGYVVTDGPQFLTEDGKKLRDALASEAAFIFSPKIATQGVLIPKGDTPTPAYALQIQAKGKAFGCHSCGKMAATDPDQPWVGDHVPSTALSASMQADIRLAKGIAANKTVLFPHCHRCSHEQAQVVKRYTGAAKLSDVPSTDRKYLEGTRPASVGECIPSTGPLVSASQGVQVQQIGVTKGCHCCGTKFPAPDYHADHVFPREFCTHYMSVLFERLGLTYPTKFYLMPQCVKCSSNQGGTLSHLAGRAQEAARKMGIPVYK